MSYLYDEPELSGNFIVDHWHGSYSLPRTYWINNFLIANIVTLVIYFGATEIANTALSLQLISLIQIASVVLILVVWIWCVGGIWKSADAHPQRGGSASWAGLAKIAVIFGALSTAGQLSRDMPAIIETAELAFGGDSLGEGASITSADDSLKIAGTLSSGTAQRFADALNNSNRIRKVVLASEGGRTIEGTRIGDLIRERSLDTHVDGTCESACTLALLAGQRRSASFGSTIGFHQPSFPGTTPSEHDVLVKDLQQDYRDAGLPYVFVRRAMDATPNDMWYPTEVELFDAGVLNTMDIERVTSDQIASAESINQSGPLQVDEITARTGAVASDNVLRQIYSVDANLDELDISFFRYELADSVRKEICGLPLIPQLIDAGAVYEFAYHDASGREIATLTVDSC